MDKIVGIADFIRNPREAFRRYEGKRLSGISAASLCFVLARIYGQPYLKKLEELDDRPLGVEYYGQTCHTIVSINGITIPWLFTRETALRAATPINLPGRCEELEQFSLRIIERGNHKVVAELAYILAFRAMLKDQPDRWDSFAENCRVAMEKCIFNTYEDCVPSYGPLAHGVPMPNWFHPATVLPRLGLAVPSSA